MANIGLALGGLAEGYQKQQQQQQEQQYRQFLMQQMQLQAAQQARDQLQQQQGLGAAWAASGRLGGGGMGGQPQQQPSATPNPIGATAQFPQAFDQTPPQTAQMPQAPSGMAWGGGAAAAAPLVRQAESGGNYNVGYGGADLSNAPKDASGFPQWAGKMGPQGISHAAGAYQFQPDTWKKYAGGLGVTDFSQGSQDKVFNAAYGAEGAKPWASNPKVMQALQPIIGEAKQTSQQVTQAVPQQQWGRSSIEDLHRAVEQANPDASPQVKMIALMQLQKLMAPEQKAELQAWAMQNKAELQTAMQETVAQFKQGLKSDQGEKGWQFIQTPEGKTVRANPNTGETAEVNLPAGASKMGSGKSQAETPEVQFPDKWEGMPDKPPPGIRQDVWSAALTYVQTGQMPSLGFQPGVRNQVVAATPAAQHALGITPSGEAEQMAKYAGQKHGEIVLGGRVANLETSINEADKAAPVVIQTSQKVPRTDLGPFINRWITGAQLQSGDPNIVAFQGALNSFLNMYARGINPTGRLTDQQQRHAYEVLNTAMAQGQIESGVKQLQYELQLMKSGLGEAAQETPKMFRPPATAPQQETPQPPGGGSPRVDNQADYDKLPPGADYIGPDGQPYKKKQ